MSHLTDGIDKLNHHELTLAAERMRSRVERTAEPATTAGCASGGADGILSRATMKTERTANDHIFSPTPGRRTNTRDL